MAQDDRLVAFQVPVAQRGGAATVEIDRLGGARLKEYGVQVIIGGAIAPLGLSAVHCKYK